MNLQLAGKSALVTGSTAGIGFAIELDFLKGRERFEDFDVFSLLHYNE